MSELLVSTQDASQKISTQIEKAESLLSLSITSWDVLKAKRDEFKRWKDYTKELLKRLFTDDALAQEFSRTSPFFVAGAPTNLHTEVEDFCKDVEHLINRLKSIEERLELIPVQQDDLSLANQQKPSLGKVFIVHGHDEAARETTARFLERLGIEPIILHEQASGNRTIIEKLDHYSDVQFAIVLLTPDDIGGVASNSENLRSRARQNVVLELGYFMAKLGRSNVCALKKGDLEIPSDFMGVVYISMYENNGWKLDLASELREAGFEIDLNDI